MMKFEAITLFVLMLTLTACSTYKTSDQRRGMCNELKSRIIFSGATGNTRQSEIETSQDPLVQHNFDNHCT